jgi:hypothetical protein
MHPRRILNLPCVDLNDPACNHPFLDPSPPNGRLPRAFLVDHCYPGDSHWSIPIDTRNSDDIATPRLHLVSFEQDDTNPFLHDVNHVDATPCDHLDHHTHRDVENGIKTTNPCHDVDPGRRASETLHPEMINWKTAMNLSLKNLLLVDVNLLEKISHTYYLVDKVDHHHDATYNGDWIAFDQLFHFCQ